MDSKLLSIAEAADMLGLKVSTLHDWTLKRKIEHIRIGGPNGLIKFERETLLNMIEAGRVRVKETE